MNTIKSAVDRMAPGAPAHDIIPCMMEEINDLRAALATRKAVVYPPDGTHAPFTVIHLGHGEVKIGDAIHDGRLPALWFGKEGLGMGVEQVMNREAGAGETIAAITFANVEGLDVLTEVIDRIRRVSFPEAPVKVDAALAAKQAKIDSLMLEFCPNEMTDEQMATWEASQRRAPEDAAPYRVAEFCSSAEHFDFAAHLAHQAKWSESTFGPGARTAGVCDHIRKELLEIEADPLDLKEWVDVVILALDGAWRCGGSPQQIIDGIVAKQAKNEGRNWPDWRTADPTKAIEHLRTSNDFAVPVVAQVAPTYDQGRIAGLQEAAAIARTVGRLVGAGDGYSFVRGTSAHVVRAIEALIKKGGVA